MSTTETPAEMLKRIAADAAKCVSREQAAYQEGKQAKANGIGINQCPYDSRITLATCWRRGWRGL